MENKDYLKTQLITYIGNKRKLLNTIEESILDIKVKSGKDKLVLFDGFAGSGVVGRMMKQHSSKLISNDFERYSYIINKSYLTNKNDIDYEYIRDKVKYLNQNKFTDRYGVGIIEEYYAPNETHNIQKGERCFYTKENARIIDNIRRLIDDEVDKYYRDIFIAMLLSKASIHTNTAGVFKGFYKSKKTKIGKFGGDGENALLRIMGEISLENMVLSNYDCDCTIYQRDTNKLICDLTDIDIAYYDPPYNQHPYGSNYHILNTICNYTKPTDISNVSGIPKNWNKSNYNKYITAKNSLDELIKNTNSKYILLSYNNEGIIPINEIFDILSKYGNVEKKINSYNTFRGSRNLKNRNLKVQELLWVIEKDENKA
jgi:adenine-specific DNA-methyltransferase|tara:strand:- start:45 stop:1157 length:1113 start_codon:yes stop_codon:yes gene_type:complete